MDDILKQLAAADPYRAIESEDLPSSRFYASTFDTIVGLDPDPETGTISVARHSKLRRISMSRRYKWGLLTPTVVAGLVGLSFAGAAIADAVTSQSPVSKFLQTEAAQPRLTSRVMLDRGGVHRLSAHVGRIARADDVTVTTTLGDGTVLAPPAPTATAAISQGQAWSAFVAYGSPPDIFVLASTPAPTIELAQISKANPPDGGSLDDTLVWVVHYQDIAVYNEGIPNQGVIVNGKPTQENPSQEIGYFDAFVDANTGQVLYTTAHATYG
jgi:hypothetical protein